MSVKMKFNNQISIMSYALHNVYSAQDNNKNVYEDKNTK
jgi:hypothetical protein